MKGEGCSSVIEHLPSTHETVFDSLALNNSLIIQPTLKNQGCIGGGFGKVRLDFILGAVTSSPVKQA